MNNIQIKILEHDATSAWDEYVHRHPDASFYHLSGWKSVIEKSFHHNAIYLSSLINTKIAGILPLVHIKSYLFGSFLISLPYLNYGGILADNKETEDLLLSEAIKLARNLKVDFLEIRHIDQKDLNLINKQHKVAMLLELPDDSQILWKNLNAKVRNQIRKAEKSELKIEIGGPEKLNDFYDVFSVNMRDLGTPVYSKNFFKNILEEFTEAKIFVTYYEEKSVAAGLVFGLKNKLDIPWASSLREYNHLCGNMLMYWHILKYACENGYQIFDFGRCTPDQGTYRFKKQWEAKPVQLNWQYWVSDGKLLPEINPDNPKYQMAIKIWQKIPIGVTKIIGPHIVKYIP